MSSLYIYGAKALALGICHAVKRLYPEHPVRGFLVKSLRDNPSVLAGLPVYGLGSAEDKNVHVLIGTPEDLHGEIAADLERHGFYSYTCVDSVKEAELMGRYYAAIGKFPSVHRLSGGVPEAGLKVYMVRSRKDRPLQREYRRPEWVTPSLAGAALAGEPAGSNADVCEPGMVRDDTGDHISGKNGNYCELTALYWIWKNILCKAIPAKGPEDYYGLFHYRRILDIGDDDSGRLTANDIDVVLSYPTIHEPDISEHHSRYMNEADWQAMLRALAGLHPAYARAFPRILAQPYLYNYNMLVAKRSVLADYCGWLFPVLERTGELSVPRGEERSDRYIGYLGENLMTLYFLYHRNDLHIAHAGRNMLL